jgi:hypothetical protein
MGAFVTIMTFLEVAAWSVLALCVVFGLMIFIGAGWAEDDD